MTGTPHDRRYGRSQIAAARMSRRVAALSESEAEAAFDIIMSGDATPSQMGAFLMALRVRGETVDEITGAARIMRAKAVRDRRAARHDRHLRHRRGCLGQLQHLDRQRAGGRRLRRAGRQARQPRALLEIGLGRCADRARRQYRRRPRDRAAMPVGDRPRLSDGAAPSQRHPPCRADPGRARHADDLQPARAVVEPGHGAPPAGRRVCARMGAADGRGARASRRGARLGRARRRPRRADHRRRDDGRRARGRQGRDLRGRSRGCRAADGRGSKIFAAASRSTMPI